ncbi:MAG: hypothetical protein ACREO2_00895 [Arenimonas sp.]
MLAAKPGIENNEQEAIEMKAVRSACVDACMMRPGSTDRMWSLHVSPAWVKDHMQEVTHTMSNFAMRATIRK